MWAKLGPEIYKSGGFGCTLEKKKFKGTQILRRY